MGQPPQGRLGRRAGGAPRDARFYISTAPARPRIALVAELTGPRPAGPITLTWQFALAYSNYLITRPGQRAIAVRTKNHPTIAPVVSINPQVVVPLTALMCGRLTVTLTATVNGQPLRETRTDILIGGTNPNWSSDGLRGVGLGQLTNPPPNDAEIWNWRENARPLQRRFHEKQQGANRFAARVEQSARFIREVAALNAWRAAEGQRPIHVTTPALTPGERDREALRGYNGFGPSVPGQYLTHVHEYEPRMTHYTAATRKNAAGAALTSVDLLAVDANGAISWQQNSGPERRRRYVQAGRGMPGEPDYVAQVLAQPS